MNELIEKLWQEHIVDKNMIYDINMNTLLPMFDAICQAQRNACARSYEEAHCQTYEYWDLHESIKSAEIIEEDYE